MFTNYHKGVMTKEVIEHLIWDDSALYIDATLGGGDHSLSILSLYPEINILAIDRDMDAIGEVERRMSEMDDDIKDRLEIVHDQFDNLKEIVREYAWHEPSGIILDLGVSLYQIVTPERGFSYDSNGPLDMRANKSQKKTAKTILNHYTFDQLVQIFSEYGQFRFSKRLARKIEDSRPINTTGELVEIVNAVTNRHHDRGYLSQVFQAIRIEVNDEVEQLNKALEACLEVLAPDSRIVVISYHSLEDRIVKKFFDRESRDCICPPEMPICRCGHKKSVRILTKKPLRPTKDEVKENPRSRSAMMRVAEKI